MLASSTSIFKAISKNVLLMRFRDPEICTLNGIASYLAPQRNWRLEMGVQATPAPKKSHFPILALTGMTCQISGVPIAT